MNESLVVIPAYNEEDNIAEVLQGIKKLDMPLDILVVNDGSRDNTMKEVLKENVSIINLPYNMGYGAALQTGFKYASIKGYRYVVQFDADGQHSACDLPVLIGELKNGNYDIVVGSRFRENPSYKVGFTKRLAISFFRFLIRSLTGKEITDPTSGLKGLSTRAFQFYSITDNFPQDFPDADVLIKMLYLRYNIHEVPAHIKERISGKSMHSGLKPILYFIKMLISIFVVIIMGNTSKEAVE